MEVIQSETAAKTWLAEYCIHHVKRNVPSALSHHQLAPINLLCQDTHPIVPIRIGETLLVVSSAPHSFLRSPLHHFPAPLLLYRLRISSFTASFTVGGSYRSCEASKVYPLLGVMVVVGKQLCSIRFSRLIMMGAVNGRILCLHSQFFKW
jgi:hypothetical protein